MNDKKPFTIELEETTPMPHPAEVEQISDVAPPAKISMSSGRGLELFGWAVSLGVSLVFGVSRNWVLGFRSGSIRAQYHPWLGLGRACGHVCCDHFCPDHS